jgi:hypothetical protein
MSIENIKPFLDHMIGVNNGIYDEVKTLRYLYLDTIVKQEQANHINPLNRKAQKCFSQTNEDGITLEILRRIGYHNDGTYLEFGPGDGMENNTLILASLGWKGSWVGDQDLAWNYQPCSKLLFQKEWIDLNTIELCMKKAKSYLKTQNIDVISLDLDGNDIYFAEAILKENLNPKLFIVEYNGKFPPPVEFQIDYNSNHNWNGTDYFGASLSSFAKLFDRYNYRLVCCNSHTGANAFFVNCDYDFAFEDVPRSIYDLYVSPRYHQYHVGHRQSFEVVEKLFRD